MTDQQAEQEAVKIFGKDSFAEFDDEGPSGRRFYVGACPTEAGLYTGFMGYSWEEALELARKG